MLAVRKFCLVVLECRDGLFVITSIEVGGAKAEESGLELRAKFGFVEERVQVVSGFGIIAALKCGHTLSIELGQITAFRRRRLLLTLCGRIWQNQQACGQRSRDTNPTSRKPHPQNVATRD